jgi:hypothetical protein
VPGEGGRYADGAYVGGLHVCAAALRFVTNQVREANVFGTLHAVEVVGFELESLDLAHLVEEVTLRRHSVHGLLVRHRSLHIE